MDIKAEAGSLKTHSAERHVPLHPYVMEVGFLEFVRGKRSGPLFFDPKRRRDEAARPQQKIVAKNVAAWVHRLGLDVGRQHRKDPNHGWRHLFRTLATEVGVPSNVISAIQGHSPGSVGESYGEVSLIAKHRAITLLPLPGLWSPDQPSR
jgi:intergrase/recombinase